MEIVLPPKLKSRPLLRFIEEVGQESEPVSIDFSNLRKVTPVGLTMLAALKDKRAVEFRNIRKCPILAYLQRMDFLKVCKIETEEESFKRHSAKGKFVPVKEIETDVQGMGSEISGCLAPGGEDFEHEMTDLYDFCWYVFTELGNNVKQHSCGNGFAAAQTTQRDGMIRIALADNGKGILKSLREVELTGTDTISHSGAIKLALKAKISSKGQPTNEGVGLTFVKELIQQTKAWLLIVSGKGKAVIDNGGKVEFSELEGNGYPGTLIGMVFLRGNIVNFDKMLNNAKQNVPLLRKDQKSGNISV